MLDLILGIKPIQQDSIKLITEKKPAIVEQVKEPTLEEKIRTNYYKCNTDIEWIWAQDATCHPKAGVMPQSNPNPTTKPVNSSGGNLYEAGQCTWYVKNRRPDIPNSWGNASAWLGNAQRQGWATGTTPMVGSVGWTSGHVVYIEAVNSDGSVTYSDMNGRWIAYELGSGVKPADYYTYIY